MPYFTIHYTADGRPYINEKNYCHKPEKEHSSSHWTWRITRDGVEHLARNNPIRPGHLPTYINDDELEDLKAYNNVHQLTQPPDTIAPAVPTNEVVPH